MSKYIVTNATTVGPGAGSAPVDIEMWDEQFEKILPAREGDPDAFGPSRRFDADGRPVSPPLIEAHTHLYCALPMSENRTDVCTEITGPELVRNRQTESDYSKSTAMTTMFTFQGGRNPVGETDRLAPPKAIFRLIVDASDRGHGARSQRAFCRRFVNRQPATGCN